MTTSLEADGFALAPDILGQAQVEFLREICASIESAGVSRREGVFAIRNLLDAPEIQDLARSPEIRALVAPILGPDCFAVRGIFFDKVPGANWKVPYHQDLSIAVESKVETDGFGPWSEKAGAIHVQPPREILENMVTVRLHLDDCGAQNGALRVLGGTHRGGKLDSAQIRGGTRKWRRNLLRSRAGRRAFDEAAVASRFVARAKWRAPARDSSRIRRRRFARKFALVAANLG